MSLKRSFLSVSEKNKEIFQRWVFGVKNSLFSAPEIFGLTKYNEKITKFR
jgi:hypothetical protein